MEEENFIDEKSNNQNENISRASLLIKWIDLTIEDKDKNLKTDEIDSYKKRYSREYFEQVIKVKDKSEPSYQGSLETAEMEHWLKQQTQPYQQRAHEASKKCSIQNPDRKGHLVFGDNVSSTVGKTPNANEDAYFSNHYFLVLADGVGAYRSMYDVDPSQYAQEIVFQSVEHASNPKFGSLLRIMERAWYFTNKPGGSTLMFARIDNGCTSHTLSVLNMGDSKCMVFRCMFNKKVEKDSSYGKYFSLVFDAEIGQENFNCPYQFGREFMDKGTPSQAILSEFEVEFGDIIIMCSDGLVDNVDKLAIERIVQTHFTNTNEILNDLMNLAGKKSQDRNATDIPFRIQDYRYGAPKIGGKPDDITIIVSRVLHSYAEACEVPQSKRRYPPG